MSELKLISPMLDNFIMGDPFSDHNGVRCCPAMKQDSNDKFIIKIISVPASENQLNALLLSGAYKDQESALSYFKELTDGYVAEAELLSDLSRLEGYIPYKSWQTVLMDDGIGYDLYLLSDYRRTLEQHFRRNPMTHLGAINLGLDMCAALAVARRAGYLYVNLKPSNIVLSEDNEYRIADLGFLNLDSLRFASLPETYRSQYTAPEICDAFSAINTTIDVYAAGLILYQAYNDGRLPSMDNIDEIESFPAPAYADYEMSEIILKACAIKPEDRWQDPVEMGQAIVAYMQRNGANDTPVIPDTPVAESEEESYKPVYADPDIDSKSADEHSVVSEEDSSVESNISTDAEEVVESDAIEIAEEDVLVPQPDPNDESDVILEENYENLSFLEDVSDDETTPDHLEEDVSYCEVTNEVSDILEQADDLLSHPTPDPVIPPEPVDIPIPSPIVLDEPDAEATEIKENTEQETPDSGNCEDEENKFEASQEELLEDEEFSDVPDKKRSNRWVVGIFSFILTAALLVVGFYYYRNFYLQPVSITLEGNDNSLIVYVNSQIDESKLTVICLDTYGNQLMQKVENGKVVFTNLAANSAYTVKVDIEGFHRLTGTISSSYTTPVQTNIVQFNAVTGNEDGSAILGFTIDGPDSNKWLIRYWTDGEAEKVVSFSGHMITLTQLTVGKEYTFVLDAEDDLFLSGNTEFKHTAAKLIKAENLAITSCADGKLTATWSAPENTTVNSWSVRCYNENGFDKTFTVAETTITVDEIDSAHGYTIEVTASGMSISERAFVTANALTVTNIKADRSNSTKIVLTWDSNLKVSDKGWVVLYTIDGTSAQEVICKNGNTAEFSPYIPGAVYSFTIQAVDGADVFGGSYIYTTEKPELFTGYDVTGNDMDFFLCKRPDMQNWDRHDLSGSDYVTEFTPSDKISFVIKMRKVYDTVGGDINVLYVIRDSNGKLVNTSTYASTWTAMWDYYYCQLDLPYTPTAAGTYTVTVYFNNLFVQDINFTIVNPS